MSRKKPNTEAPKRDAWWVPTAELSKEDAAELRQVCNRDYFVGEIEDICGEHLEEIDFLFPKKGRVTPGQYRAALKILRNGGKRAMELLPELDWLTGGRVKAQAFMRYNAPEDFDGWARKHPDLLSAAAQQLLDGDPGRNRNKDATQAGVFAALRIRKLFKFVNLNFTTYADGDAARCLRIILRTDQNLDYYLREAKKFPLP